MSELYKWAQGHDVGALLLNTPRPQPHGIFAAPVVRDYTIAPGYHEQGLYTIWTFDVIETESVYNAMLTELDLDNQTVAPVTIRTRNERGNWTIYNAYISLPEPNQDMKWANFFLRDVNFIFTDLEEA